MVLSSVHARRHRHLRFLAWLAAAAAVIGATSASAQTQAVTIAAHFPLTGGSAPAGAAVLEATRLAIDEANATQEAPPILLEVQDDRSTDDGAREVARRIAASNALVVVGPGTTTSALAAGPIYGQAGMAAIVPFAHGAGGEASPTTYRLVFSTAEMGEALANYLHYVLGGNRAVVLHRDNGYGRPIAAGFRRTAERLGLTATYHVFSDVRQAADLARAAAADPDHPAIVLGMNDPDATPVMAALRRHGAKSLVLGTSAVATDAFADGFADQPEYRRDHGFFTDGLYAASPLIFDSANADTLAFAARYRARYGREPRWEAAQGYDAARLAIAAVRAATRAGGADASLSARRQAALGYLASLDSPARAVPSLTGPLWFTADRGRPQATRIGRFQGALFESAPIQLVPVSSPSTAEIASGTLVQIGPDQYARRQQVVYTGVFLTEVPRVDIALSTFTADFYLWIRFARIAGQLAADPTEITFPDLVRGNFDAGRAAEQGDLDDGTTYRLWHVRGDFKNDFDLHRYPFDRQTLALRLFNARAALDRMVYVQDRRSLVNTATPNGSRPGALAAATPFDSYVAPAAFRNLTQWDVVSATERRDVQVTHSALGNPRLVGAEQQRELSGFTVIVELRRRVAATLAKTLLPLGLMAAILFASLYFPAALVKEKVTVAITAALSGAVLLSAINAQLGNVG